MGRETLEEITLIKIGTTLWVNGEVKKLLKKNSLGLINIEKALQLVMSISLMFPISAHLKNRLIEIIEKIGYGLYVFLTKPYIDCDFELDTIKWTPDGLIHGSDTLRALLRNSDKYSISQFRYSCELFDESLIREIWSQFDEEDRQLQRQVDTCNVFSTYWTDIMEGNVIFPDSFASYIIGFKRSQSLELNMLWHSIAVSNHAAIHYFHQKLQESDRIQLGLTCNANEHEILQCVLKTPNDASFAFILSYLEMPIPSEKARNLIFQKMNPRLIKGLLDHVLRRINICGDLHYNIFRSLMYGLRYKWTLEVRDNLHFYPLTLLGRGRLEKFDFLPDKDCKKILHRQILYRLKCKRGLAIFVTIHWNNYTNLLSEFLDWLADNEEDKDFFREFVSALAEGRHYDL